MQFTLGHHLFWEETHCVDNIPHVWPQNWLKCFVLKVIDFKVKDLLVFTALGQLYCTSGAQGYLR